MKSLTFALAIFLSLTIFGQAEDENFYLANSHMTWTKAYSTDKSKEEVYAHFEKSKIFSHVIIEKGKVFGKLKPHATDPKITGVAGVPTIVNKTDFKGNVMIEYRPKEGDYVVNFTDMLVVGRGDFLKKKEEQTFEQNYLRKDISEYRPYFLKAPKKVYNTTFTEIFEMK